MHPKILSKVRWTKNAYAYFKLGFLSVLKLQLAGIAIIALKLQHNACGMAAGLLQHIDCCYADWRLAQGRVWQKHLLYKSWCFLSDKPAPCLVGTSAHTV